MGSVMLLFHSGRENITLKIYFDSLIYVLRDLLVFGEKCRIFNVVKALSCQYIYSRKGKRRCHWQLERHILSLSHNTAGTFESLMCSPVFKNANSVCKQTFSSQTGKISDPDINWRSIKSARAPPNDHQAKTRHVSLLQNLFLHTFDKRNWAC